MLLRQSKRTFVEELDFLTSTGSRVSAVVTDLGVLEPDATGELCLMQVHPGVGVEQTRLATGWSLKVAEQLSETCLPRTLNSTRFARFGSGMLASGNKSSCGRHRCLK